MPKSQNGWSAGDITQTDVQLVPGTRFKIRLRKGDAGWLLRRILAWIDKNVEDLDGSVLDDWGWADRPNRNDATVLSNHASGTAGDANATKHPNGKHGTWSAAAKAKIHGHLAEYKDPADGINVIRWGEDYTKTVDGMHFEIVGDAASVARVAAKLRGVPSTGTTPTQPQDVTIYTWSIRNGCGQEDSKAPAMRISDGAYHDCRAFVAWARAKSWLSTASELLWVGQVGTQKWEAAAHTLTEAVKAVQKHNGLVVDGVFGPKTGAVMAKSGYRII